MSQERCDNFCYSPSLDYILQFPFLDASRNRVKSAESHTKIQGVQCPRPLLQRRLALFPLPVTEIYSAGGEEPLQASGPK